MLQRPIARALRTLTTHSPLTPSTVCKCRCGALVQSNGSPSAPRRTFRSKAKAPSTRRRDRARYKNMAFYEFYPGLRQYLNIISQKGLFKTPPEDALKFLDDFNSLSSPATLTANPDKTLALVQQYGLNEEDLMLLATMQLSLDDRSSQNDGKKLVLTLSRCEMVEATIRVMAEAVLQARKKPRVLHIPETQHAKEHLAKVANEKTNYRAMVLEGKVARLQGDEERAIRMWTDAMAEAVNAAERVAATEEKTGITTAVERDPLELSSPWIELMLIHWERTKFKGKNEISQCEWAMKIGCDQDDPTSHYYASTFLKSFDSQGNHLGTSDWLYHITKAASSGHPKAAYELAVFYAESGWKYIEDEPPDHVKPTAFDSYPASTSTVSNGSGNLWDRLREFLWFTPRREVKPHESLFHNAIFPDNAFDRQALASRWLSIALAYTYAPAHLFGARMDLAETLWAGANAPKSALNLTKERYSFASKADYEAGVPIEKPIAQVADDVPNPFYSPRHAKELIRDVFFAHKAASFAGQAREAHRKNLRASRHLEVQNEEDLMEETFFEKFGFRIQVWFRFPEVREMYEDQIDDLHRQAKEICDERGWDIYDDDNALLYRHSGGGKKVAASSN